MYINIKNLFILTLSLSFFSSCSHQAIIGTETHSIKGSYVLPSGWRIDYPDVARTKNSLKLRGSIIGMAGGISLDMYEIKGTQNDHATKYLKGVHAFLDPSITCRKLNHSVCNPHHGEIFVWEYQSEYYGNHLVSFVVAHDGYVCVEIWATNKKERIQYQNAFFEIVATVKIKPENKKTHSRTSD